MILQYNEIYSVFLSMVTDYSFLNNEESFVYEQMNDWLHISCANPRILAKFSNLSLNDETSSLTCELKTPINEGTDIEFVKNIFAKSMVIAWLEPQVKNVLLTKQFIGGREEKYFSQSQHLKEIQVLLTDTKTELSKILRDYGYLNNSYIQE